MTTAVRRELVSAIGRRLVLVPRAGAFGGAVRTEAGEVIAVPSAAVSVADNASGVLLGTFAGGAGGVIELMPPGGSSLPVDLLLLSE